MKQTLTLIRDYFFIHVGVFVFSVVISYHVYVFNLGVRYANWRNEKK